jgi:eukaryotic-like serine/threonine-protein kinase
MSSGPGEKPPSGSGVPTSPGGRPPADTPQRLVVRSRDGSEPGQLGSSDTAVAHASAPRTSATQLQHADTDAIKPLDPSVLEDIVGTTLSERYLVTRKVGQGGMGAVYEATHTLIGKRVAVKVLLDKYARREAIVARLKQEAQLASSIGNEHIIDITDFGNTADGRTFVVMEFLEGESLAECLAREITLPEQRILRVAAQAGSALAAAHAKGIVHRDIKPENLFLLKRRDTDFVKVVDFGISKSLRASDEQEEQPRLTQTGMVLGTPLYMSPEQARGDEDLDHRVDVYALGVIMYESACGHVPFAGTNYLSVISQVLNEEPQRLRDQRPELSEEFEAIVMRAMTKEREQRYPDAQAMIADINALLDDPTRSTERAKITGPRRRLPRPKVPRWAWAIAGGGVAVALVAIAVVVLMGGEQKKIAQEAEAHAKLPIAPADAAPTIVSAPADAAPARELEVKVVRVHVESTPQGAEIYGDDDGRDYGPTPTEVPLPVHDRDVHLRAQLAGYDDHPFTVNPLTQDNDPSPFKIKLDKAIGHAPRMKQMHPANGSAAGSGSAAPRTNPTGGELHNNPFTTGGTVH